MTAPPPPDPPLRIALCSGRLGGGGIGMVMLNLAGALQALGHAVDLLHFSEDPADLAGRAPPPGCTPVTIGARSRQALPAVLRYLRRARPDLVISARDYINLLMLTARRLSGLGRLGPALIWTFHTHRASELVHQAGCADRLADRVMRCMIGRVEGLVAVSAGVAAGLVQDLGLAPGRITTIPNPVWTATLEAMAMGKAVVASDVAALAETIDHDHTGLLFARGDVAALEAALARLVGDPDLRTRLGKRGRDWVLATRWTDGGLVRAEVAELARPN